MKPKISLYSIVIAIYNRQDELQELLQSLCSQTQKNFEVIVVDDGSEVDLRYVVAQFSDQLSIEYYYKENSGPGLSRNFGVQQAQGEYILFLDSDCIVPPQYIENIHTELEAYYTDAFGGSDAAHKSFSPLQKAISYSMTSFFTTGGIRGKKKALTKFQPRSFNMGVSKNAFVEVGGFSDLRIGEDPDLSMTLWEKGFTTRYFPSVSVFHKRRNTLQSFAKQVYQFGVARPILNQRHPQYKKLVFWFPTLFLIGSFIAIFMYCISLCTNSFSMYSLWFGENIDSIDAYKVDIKKYFWKVPLMFLWMYYILINIHATILNRSLIIGSLSVLTTAIQLYGYGWGFLKSWVSLHILKIPPKKAFPKHYYQNDKA